MSCIIIPCQKSNETEIMVVSEFISKFSLCFRSVTSNYQIKHLFFNYLSAYRSVFKVCSQQFIPGEIMAIYKRKFIGLLRICQILVVTHRLLSISTCELPNIKLYRLYIYFLDFRTLFHSKYIFSTS